MTIVKAEELRTKTPDELKAQLVNLKKEAFNLRFQGSTGQLENLSRIGQVRREIARVKTVLTEKPRARGTRVMPKRDFKWCGGQRQRR